LLILLLLLAGPFALSGEQEQQSEKQEEQQDTKLVPELTYQQHPGLAYAASKIYFSDQRYSISGFGETNFVRYSGGNNPDLGDIELFYTNLYRFSVFFGYKLTDRIIFNSEFLGEFLHDGTRETGTDVIIEAMMDFLLHRRFNVRVGYYPLPIGYINNNDEPVMFNSVNRPEVERVIIPTSWISLGMMGYGQVAPRLSYSVGIVGGLDAREFFGGSWVRQGRQVYHSIPSDYASLAQLSYHMGERFQAGVSGYHGASGLGEVTGGEGRIKMPTTLGAIHARYSAPRYNLTAVAAQGSLGRTTDLFARTGRVLGSRTYGWYLEGDHDVLPYFRRGVSERSVSVFSRYERLNTHHRIDGALANQARREQDLRIVTVGANYRPRRNLIFKANYQFRSNFHGGLGLPESNLTEFGFGFIY
jgi:hypothetical protein